MFGFLKKLIFNLKTLGAIGILLLAGVVAGVLLLSKVMIGLPDVSSLRNYSPALITTLYDVNNEKVAEYYVEKRILTPLKDIPKNLKKATMAIEDDNFYNHFGVDIFGIIRAALVNIKAGRVVQGGSTITQQVAKQIFLTRERTFERKLKELILSLQLEQEFTKDEILEIYLNQIYYGHGAYGVEAAANLYFGKKVQATTLAEQALLAGLPKAPNGFSPHRNMNAAVKRRNLVLKRMLELDYISTEVAKAAIGSEVNLVERKKALNKAPFFAEHVRRYIEKHYGAEKLYNDGLKIYTTINLKWQMAAQRAIKKGIEKADRRLGYRGPIGWMNPTDANADWDALNVKQHGKGNPRKWLADDKRIKMMVVEVAKDGVSLRLSDYKAFIDFRGFGWAHKPDPEEDGRWVAKLKNANAIGLKAGDVVEVRLWNDEIDGGTYIMLDQTPEVQAAIINMENSTGAVRAMVGGYDYEVSSFNRAVQAKRQVGSSFKPVIYSAALNSGFTPASIVIDSPIIFEDDIGDFKNWKPVNFNQKFFGPTTVREAVTHSRNIVTIKVLQSVGIPYTINYARQLGITSDLANNLSLALGSSSLSLQEITSVYGVFANEGIRNEPYFIERIEDSSGNILEEHTPNPVKVISPASAFLMRNILRSVVQEGTGSSVRSVGVPAGGKTGTTNDYMDAWFIGFTSNLVTGVWVGKDKKERLGKNETGSRAAAPIWLGYMKEAVKDTLHKPFTVPEGIVFMKIDRVTGALATPSTVSTRFEAFRETEVPTSYTPPPAKL